MIASSNNDNMRNPPTTIHTVHTRRLDAQEFCQFPRYGPVNVLASTNGCRSPAMRRVICGVQCSSYGIRRQISLIRGLVPSSLWIHLDTTQADSWWNHNFQRVCFPKRQVPSLSLVATPCQIQESGRSSTTLARNASRIPFSCLSRLLRRLMV